MKLLIVVSIICTFLPQLIFGAGVNISSIVKYENKQWIGNVACQFQSQNDCELSMHVQGRRIDLDSQDVDENLFVSCFSPNTAVALTLSNFSYDHIQDYTCFEDKTQEYAHTWLSAVPKMEVVGTESVGAFIQLFCNSVLGAPLYWVFPGKPENNAGIIITEFSNEENSTTTATFKVESNDNNAEYKCCVKVKDGQDSQLPCASHTVSLNSNLQLISTFADYNSSSLMVMSCVYQSNPSPDPNKIDWQQCQSSSYCYTVSSSSYTRVVDNTTHTLNTTLKIAYSSSYPYYKCRYNSNTSYTFTTILGTYAPKVKLLDKRVYYSKDGSSVEIKCSVMANPSPIINWIKTNVLDFANGSEIITNNHDEYSIQTTQKLYSEWETTLYIFPFDVQEDNAIYTCWANNTLGANQIQTSTNLGPADMNFQVMSYPSKNAGKNTVQGVCSFKAFPFPPSSYINVAAAENHHPRTSTTYNDELMEVVTTIEFDISNNAPPITLQCNAFDRFNTSIRVSKTVKTATIGINYV